MTITYWQGRRLHVVTGVEVQTCSDSLAVRPLGSQVVVRIRKSAVTAVVRP